MFALEILVYMLNSLFANPVFQSVDISLYITVTLLSLRSRMPILVFCKTPREVESTLMDVSVYFSLALYKLIQ